MCPAHTPTQKSINEHMGEKEMKNSAFFPDYRLIVCNNFTNVYFNHLLFPKFRRVSWDCFSLTSKSREFSCFSTDPDQCVEELLALNTSLVLVSTSL